jgi:hypothetical protein
MAEGASLREVCRDNDLPESTVRQWIRDDRDGFAARYQMAGALQIESWSDQIIEIANREDLDPQDKRLRCDNLKWLLSSNGLCPSGYRSVTETYYWSPATPRTPRRYCTSRCRSTI